MPFRSGLFECSVMHHRLAPKEHQFRYKIFLFALDLDELDAVAARLRFFSRNRANLYSFRDEDHLSAAVLKTTNAHRHEENPDQGVPSVRSCPRGSNPVKENVVSWLAQQGVTLPPDARIQLLTLPRVMGYVFNPVSFYFCADAAGAPLCAVAEVGNTFREMKPFLLRREDLQPDGVFRRAVPKHFYVSPFFALDLVFDFKLRVPGESLEIHIDDREDGRRVLLTTLAGRRVPLTDAQLAWQTLKCPLVTLKVISMIHWNALRLWLKNVPWHRKAANPHLQRDVMRPHESLRRAGGVAPVESTPSHAP
ncbi:MAG: DUF1365 domain-containing protein [Verrucomicrobia bacterium]|nr:DUF1365 domain-containing protein [Verrucomicrobiota bacterium]